MGADPLKLANPNLKTKIKAKKLAGQKALDKFKKASLALREHKKLGWDGRGATKRDAPQAGMIKYETKASQKKYGPWKNKLNKLQKIYDSLK